MSRYSVKNEFRIVVRKCEIMISLLKCPFNWTIFCVYLPIEIFSTSKKFCFLCYQTATNLLHIWLFSRFPHFFFMNECNKIRRYCVRNI